MYVSKDGWLMEENPFVPPKEEHRIIAGNWTPKVTLMTDRDTHFLGFARLLLQEMDARRFIADDTSLQHDEMQTLIAQRAYDLVYHALEDASHGEHAFDAEIIFHRQVTDLTQWPESPTPPPDARVVQAPSDDQLL